eukprot:1549468-Rhodomonas_salina.1
MSGTELAYAPIQRRRAVLRSGSGQVDGAVQCAVLTERMLLPDIDAYAAVLLLYDDEEAQY